MGDSYDAGSDLYVEHVDKFKALEEKVMRKATAAGEDGPANFLALGLTAAVNDFFWGLRKYDTNNQYQGEAQHYSSLTMAYHLYKRILATPAKSGSKTKVLSQLQEKILSYALNNHKSCFNPPSQEEGEPGQTEGYQFIDVLDHILYDIQHPPDGVQPYQLFSLFNQFIWKLANKVGEGENTPSILKEHIILKQSTYDALDTEQRADAIDGIKKVLTSYFYLDSVTPEIKDTMIQQLFEPDRLGDTAEKYEILTHLINEGVLQDLIATDEFNNSSLKTQLEQPEGDAPLEGQLKATETDPEKIAIIELLQEKEGCIIGDTLQGILQAISDKKVSDRKAQQYVWENAWNDGWEDYRQQRSNDPISDNLYDSDDHSIYFRPESPEERASIPKETLYTFLTWLTGLIISLSLLIPMLTATTIAITAPFVVLAAVAVISLVGVIYGAVKLIPKLVFRVKMLRGFDDPYELSRMSQSMTKPVRGHSLSRSVAEIDKTEAQEGEQGAVSDLSVEPDHAGDVDNDLNTTSTTPTGGNKTSGLGGGGG